MAQGKGTTMMQVFGTSADDSREYALSPTGLIFSRPTSGKRRLWHNSGPYGETFTLETARSWLSVEGGDVHA